MNDRFRTDKELSLQFYNFLCNKIGRENIVKARRLYYVTQDYVKSTGKVTCILSGSRAEGLDMKNSDVDFMALYTYFNILENVPNCYNFQPNTFVMKTEDTKPGFTQLQLCSATCTVSDLCEQVGEHFFLSSTRVKTSILSLYKRTSPVELDVIHGPCISDKNETMDFAFCVRCPIWIKQARHWVTRNRFWPSVELVSKVVSYGVLFVPLGCKNSRNEDLEWRISFSVAEKHLIYSFTHTQLLCYAMLKILLKEILEKSADLKGILCSYFLKTIVFWVSEELPLTAWVPENIITCFMNCFRRLVYCVNYSILPHYFITDNNLFEDRFSSENGIYLKNLINDLYQSGHVCLMHSESLSSFFQSEHKLYNVRIRSKYDDWFDQFSAVNACQNHMIKNEDEDQNILNKMVDFLNRHKKKQNLYVYYTVFFQACQDMGRHPSIASSPGYCNKANYQIHKKYFPFIMLGIRADAFNGWLYLATYYYCFSGFKLSLEITEYALNKYRTLHKNASVGDRTKHWNISDMKVIYRESHVADITFIYHSKLIPSELKTEFEFKKYLHKDFLVYAVFLDFLCFYKLNEYDNCQGSLQFLECLTHNRFYHGSESKTLKAESFNCLGMAYFMLNDLDAATACFINSLQLDEGQQTYVNWMLHKIRNTM